METTWTMEVLTSMIPDDVWIHIFQYCVLYPDLLRCIPLVNKRFYQLASLKCVQSRSGQALFENFTLQKIFSKRLIGYEEMDFFRSNKKVFADM